jgi:hypothetical protein
LHARVSSQDLKLANAGVLKALVPADPARWPWRKEGTEPGTTDVVIGRDDA